MSIIATLTQIRGGQLVATASEELQDVITSVIEQQKAGSFQLTLTIRPNGENAVIIASSIKATQAKASVGDALFYADTGGTLHQRDPRQTDIEDELARRRGQAQED